MSSFASAKQSRSVSLWLLGSILLVIAIILVGGATRLTNSGLSITEWRPITGALPPMSPEAWAQEFSKYKQIPEFLAENPGMDMAGFKFIYFMEWSHRQLARFLGLFYALPMFFFMRTGRIGRGTKLRFISVFLLIGVQAGIGWWMVASGLTHRVDVSQYRLATHLSVALIILAMLVWIYQDQRNSWPAPLIDVRYKTRTGILLFLVFLQIIAGAFVAGTHAGLVNNTWPLMDGGLLPNDYWALSPWWLNIFENRPAIQFNHRMLGYAVFIMAVWVWMSVKKHRDTYLSPICAWLMVALLLQIILGVTALLKVSALPFALAHQAGAIFVFICAVLAARSARTRTY